MNMVSPKSDGFDHYTYPGSNVLINKLGHTDQAKLDKDEATLAAIGAIELATEPLPVEMNAAYLKHIHRKLLGDVYDWAGEFRSPEKTSPWINKLFAELKSENYLRGLDEDAFSKRAAYYYGKLNIIQPFIEGGARTQRTFIRQLANGAGYNLNWLGISQAVLSDASMASNAGHMTKLAALIGSNLERIPAKPPAEPMNSSQALRDAIRRRVIERKNAQAEAEMEKSAGMSM